MPNHVENDLRITGSKKELLRFKESAQDNECLLSANKFIPYPEEFVNLDKKAKEYDEARAKYEKSLQKNGESEKEARIKAYMDFPSIKDGYNSGGYDWCVKNWGTKWGMYETELIEENLNEDQDEWNNLFYTFQSAWSPPLPVIRKMSELFPTLEFDLRYFEGGSGFNGMFQMRNGKVLSDKRAEYFGDRGG